MSSDTGCVVDTSLHYRRGADSNKLPATTALASGHTAAPSPAQAHMARHRARAAVQTATMYRDGPCFVAKPYTLKVEAASRGRTSTVARCTVDLARLCACSPAGSRTDLRLRLKCAPACPGHCAGSSHLVSGSAVHGGPGATVRLQPRRLPHGPAPAPQVRACPRRETGRRSYAYAVGQLCLCELAPVRLRLRSARCTWHGCSFGVVLARARRCTCAQAV